MRLIPSVAEATAPLSKRGAKRTPHLSQGPAPGLLGGPCFPRWGKWPKADRGAFRFAPPFRSCRRGALRFASPMRSPVRQGFGFRILSANAKGDDILSLCLSKEKEPKRNDTREGKIAISSPPETYPNGNAQEGRAPPGTPPGRTDPPGGAVFFGSPRRAFASCLPLRGRCREATEGALPAGRGQAPPRQ